MLLLQRALETLASTLERAMPLPALIAELEFRLSRDLQPVRIAIRLDGDGPSDAAASVPLRADGIDVGTIHMTYAGGRVDTGTREIVRLIAAPIAAAIAYRRGPRHDDGAGAATHIDALCRIPNRRAFDEHLPAAWERAAAKRAPLVIAVADVDYFKSYNDRYGHVAGDRCLAQIASLLVRRRNGDDGFAARYGGEEFILIFEQSTLDRAVLEIQAIFDRLAALNLEHAGTTLGRVSLSVGLAAATPTAQIAAVKLIDEADRALYHAKRLGRNRISTGSFVSAGPIVAKLHQRRGAYAAASAPTFGRADDLARMLSALRHTRLMTLVGPAGIGKTRLLELVADEALSRLHRPVVFVESQLLRADVDPVAALASACDLTLDARSVLETVTDALDEREAIVILDDIDPSRDDLRALCEHLCASAPRAAFVAAAHAPLNIAAERAIVVPPLDDDAALALLAFHGVDTARVSRDSLRQLGGNPAIVAAAAGWIAQLGVETATRRLGSRNGIYADPNDLAALFTPAAERV